jgi:hypothetical protein
LSDIDTSGVPARSTATWRVGPPAAYHRAMRFIVIQQGAARRAGRSEARHVGDAVADS